MEWAGQPARPEISGVYRAIYRGNSDANPSIWRRIPEFNSLAEANQYGLQVRVKYGAFNGGKWYYLVNSHTMGESFTRLLAAPASAGATTLTLATIDNLLANYATISGTPGITDGTLITAVNTTTKVITLGTATTGALTNSTPLTFPMFNSTSSALDPGGALTFSPDAVDPDVALLADGPYTISRNITVQNNRAVSGKSILGGNTAATSTFSGTITLNKALHVTAAAGGTARFTGDISGAFGLTKSGAGTVVLEGSKSYSGGTSIRATVAELEAGAKLVCSGTLDLSGASDVLEITGTLDPNTRYTFASYGSLNGEFDTVTLPQPLRHVLSYSGNQIALIPMLGTTIIVR
jgi:autotransporter-associated beta strand protein